MFSKDLMAQAWAIRPEILESLIESGGKEGVGLLDFKAEVTAGPMTASGAPTSVGMVRMHGVMTEHGGEWSVSTRRVGDAIKRYAFDPGIGMILMDIDSPGGSVFGTMELAELVKQVRARKPIHAVASSMAASAAYWVGSQASAFHVTPGGQVGSIGVLVAHTDVSKLMDRIGVKVSFIHAGRHKVEGHPFEPLQDETRANLQQMVDGYYSLFTRAVASGRDKPVEEVRGGFGEGRMVVANQALSMGMVDSVRTVSAVIEDWQRLASKRNKA